MPKIIFALIILLSDEQKPTLVQFDTMLECQGAHKLALTLPFKTDALLGFECVEVKQEAAK